MFMTAASIGNRPVILNRRHSPFNLVRVNPHR
jgi:hypothetical protein